MIRMNKEEITDKMFFIKGDNNQQIAVVKVADLMVKYSDVEDAIKALEKAAKQAQESIEIFKQGLDKAEEQAKQILRGRSEEE